MKLRDLIYLINYISFQSQKGEKNMGLNATGNEAFQS